MSCDGGHLGFPIGIKNRNLVKDIPMIIHYSLGSVGSLVSEKKIFEISANQSILLALAAILNIRLERKTFVEDHPRSIPAKFGSNRPSGFGEEA
jgi:hypothetical protein